MSDTLPPGHVDSGTVATPQATRAPVMRTSRASTVIGCCRVMRSYTCAAIATTAASSARRSGARTG